MTLNGQSVQDILIAVGLIGGIAVYARNRLPRQTIADLKEHSASQDKLIEDLRAGREQLIKDLSDLQGQVRVYKELPLRELADGIKKVGEGQEKVLKVLIDTASIAARSANDGGLLVKTKEGTPATVKMEKK